MSANNILPEKILDRLSVSEQVGFFGEVGAGSFTGHNTRKLFLDATSCSSRVSNEACLFCSRPATVPLPGRPFADRLGGERTAGYRGPGTVMSPVWQL